MIDLKLTRTESEFPVPSHGGDAVGVTWALTLNGVVIQREYDRYRWHTDPKQRAKIGAEPPSAMKTLFDGLSNALKEPTVEIEDDAIVAVAKAIYETSPTQDQDVDLDGRPTGPAFTYEWRDIEDSLPATYEAVCEIAANAVRAYRAQ